MVRAPVPRPGYGALGPDVRGEVNLVLWTVELFFRIGLVPHRNFTLLMQVRAAELRKLLVELGPVGLVC